MKTQSEALKGLMVIVPCGELAYARYFQYLFNNKDFAWLLWRRRVQTLSGAYPHQSAQALAMAALKIPGWTRLLILEHDHEFPEDVFRKHAGYTQPVVAGSYVLRDIEEPLPVFYEWDDAGTRLGIPNAEKLNLMFKERGLYEMDVVPMGCTSIRRDVLEKWPPDQPFFSSYTNAQGAAISHDVFFCRVAKDAGWTLYIDTSLRVGHFVLVPINDTYFLTWWNTVGYQKATAEAAKVAT